MIVIEKLAKGSFASVMAGLLTSCAAIPDEGASPVLAQPLIIASAKAQISQDGLQFKDLNASGVLDPYEDWRLTPYQRADDLVSRMTLEEKAGMMLIASHNPACDGSITPDGRSLIEEQQMTRFILRAKATAEGADCSVKLTGFALRGGYDQTPLQLANFTNSVQQLREASRLGIPALFKDNARNHVEANPTFGIAAGAGAFSQFPKEAGLAAAALGGGAPLSPTEGAPPVGLQPDTTVLRDFTRVMSEEWRAVGLRGMYGYMLDLGTEPRWSRFHETWTEDADLMGAIARQLVAGLQGPKGNDGLALSPETSVSMTLKHFPGGGPQQLGLDAHYTFGKNQFYTDPSGRYGFDYHLKPFAEAIDAGVGAIMPYYGVPVGAVHNGETLDSVGMAFSSQILTDLLREEMGFKGYINSDSGVIQERGWGFENFRINPDTGSPYSISDRTALAIRAGTDVLSEFREAATILDLVAAGKLNEVRDINPIIHRLLIEQFALGLFENPYVDAGEATGIVGSTGNKALGLEVQRKSIVLLQNREIDGKPVLPLQSGSTVYVMGLQAAEFERPGFTIVDGNYGRESTRPKVPESTDFAVLNVMVNNAPARRYQSDDPATGGKQVDAAFGLVNPSTGQLQETWGAQDPCVYVEGDKPDCVDSRLVFGGNFPWETGQLSFTAMAASEGWLMYPSLADIQGVMTEIGDPRRVIISVYFRNPYVLDVESGVRDAGGLLATFGVSAEAQVDVITGVASPGGRLPFALPASLEAVRKQHSDAPGYNETSNGELFPFGFGLGYASRGE